MASIVLTGGGTAGHCTPHLAILPYLKKDFDNIYYVGSENGIEKEIIKNTDIPYFSVTCAKLNRNLNAKNLFIPFKVAKGIFQAGKILDRIKPDVVFSKGGYVSLPTVVAAKQRNVPVIAHESDYTMGLANKISAKFCKKILTSFPSTAKEIKNGEFVGPPLRKSLFAPSKSDVVGNFGFSGERPILLVTGGSQGAKALNDVVCKALPELTAKYDVIHLCGKNNLMQNPPKKGYYQAEFLNKIENAFACATVCVTRAGSNTLFELMSLKTPCVLVPLPKGASRGDQILNASYFQQKGLAYVISQENLTEDSLIFAIDSVFANRYNLKRNFEKYPIKDASRQISRIIADYLD